MTLERKKEEKKEKILKKAKQYIIFIFSDCLICTLLQGESLTKEKRVQRNYNLKHLIEMNRLLF
jgi:hypothetical protein